MKILGLCDLHSNGQIPIDELQKIVSDEQIDAIILAGDLTTFGTLLLIKKILMEFEKLKKPIFYIPGNMDEKGSDKLEFGSIIPLHAQARQFSDLFIMGLGGSNPTPMNTPYTLSENEIEKYLLKTRKQFPRNKAFILITHAPPKDSKADIISNGQHVGSVAIKKFIESESPLMILCGHIHESRSISKINNVLCINPGPAKHKNCSIINIIKNTNGELIINGKLASF